MRQVAAAGLAREQEMITQQQQPVAQYSGTELDILLGQGHPYWHQPTVQQMLQEKQLPTVQQMLQEQQLADAVGFGRHQHNTTLVQQDAAYANGEHRGGAGTTMAFLSPGSAKDGSFLVDQQPQPNGHQMDSSLAPLPPSLGQLHAQASHQQRTDGGGQGLNSDLAAYLHYESLSRYFCFFFLTHTLQFLIWLCGNCLAVLQRSCSLYSKRCLLPIRFLKESKRHVHCFLMLTL